MAAAPVLEANANPAASPDETNFRQGGLSRWMEGLKSQLNSPSLGAGEDEPVTKPIKEPAPVKPATPDPVPAPVPAPATPNPAPTEPKPAPTAPGDLSADETKWPRSAKEWKNYTEKNKARTQEYETKISALDAQIKELQGKNGSLSPEVQKEIETLKKENDQFSQQLRLLSVTSHPKFKQYFETKTNATLGQLKSFIKPDQLDSVTKLVQMPDSEDKNARMDELLLTLSPLQQGRLFSVINGLDSIRAEHDSEVTRAQQDYEQMLAQAKTQKEQQQAKFKSVLDEAIKGLQDAKTGRPEYQLRDGETEWNESVKRRIESARALITGNLPPETMFKAAFDAAAHADVLAGYRALLDENKKLQAQVSAMTAANPKMEPGNKRPETTTGTEPSLPKDARPNDFVKKWVRDFGQTMQGGA